MDFFGILFDMKNGKKIPYSKNYFDTLFAENLAGVTTLTGTLPLTFRTSETALRSWTIYGNNTAHIATSTGVLPLTFTTTEDKLRDWEIFGNDDVGENLTNPTDDINSANISDKGSMVFNADYKMSLFKIEQGVTYTICPENSISVGYIYGIFVNKPTIGSQTYDQTRSIGVKTFVAPITGWCAFRNGLNSTKSMAVKGSTAPDHYIPYQQGVGEQRVDGYYVPLTISQQGQTDKNYDIYIGDSPLTEGETISKTSTGVELELFEGENTVSTTLYNKPETAISYVDYLGVGEKSGNDWQIPLTISDGTNTTSVNVPIDAPLTEGESVTDELTISTFEGANTLDTTLTNKPQMTITYKGG